MSREDAPAADVAESKLSSEADLRLKGYLEEAVLLEKAGDAASLAKALTLYQQYEQEFKTELGGLAPEALKTTMAAFLEATFKSWSYNADQLKAALGKIPELVNPTNINYEARKDDIDAAKSGEYALNPEVQNLDFDVIPKEKYLVPDLSAFNGHPLAEVAEHIKTTYGSTYRILGLEYFDYLVKNPDKAPDTAKANLKDGKYYFFFGSLLRHHDGRWVVAYAHWSGSRWARSGDGLDNGWHASDRVVLLEK